MVFSLPIRLLARGVAGRLLPALLALAVTHSAAAAWSPATLTTERWPASWIEHPETAPTDYGVYHFRTTLRLAERPASFPVRVSADNRYRLFVNGVSVTTGPARSDLLHWRYDPLELAPYLHAGDNVIAAQVWNWGDERPQAQMSWRTAFILQGETEAAQAINTGAQWTVVRNLAYTPLPVDRAALQTYIVVGPGDEVNGAVYPWGWERAGFAETGWVSARAIDRGVAHGVGTDVSWWLTRRTIPQPEETPQRLAAVRRSAGVTVPAGFLAGTAPVTVPAHTRATLLLDQGHETNAFPQLRVSGGRGAAVTLTYAEALVDAQRQKGARGAVEGRTVLGVADRFRADGGAGRVFSTLAYRTYRYIEVAVETADEPLTIDDLHGVFTAYPLVERGRFASDDPALAEIWAVGWRTARLCAYETYMDCPYYEQLQYVGDTRIQALISYYVAGDDRLARNAIELYDQSRVAEGLTLSRYPSVAPQIISTFSLFWADMVRDYWLHRGDEAFVRARLTGMAAVLEWFEQRIDARTGLLGPLPYWSFVDWPEAWRWDQARGTGGVPAGAVEGGSAIITLQFAGTLRRTAELFAALGRKREAAHYRALAERLNAATLAACWDESRRLVADTPAKTEFSQHANALAVLAGALPPQRARELIGRVADDESLIPCTLYFGFYLRRALKEAGLGDQYVTRLGPWRAMLAKGLTTFAEKEDPTRSDCHAWSASPNYEFLATVCGIEPASPGFKTVRIEPHLGPLMRVEGAMPHPAGEVAVSFTRAGDRLSGTVVLPAGVTGELRWHGRRLALRAGGQTVSL